MYYYDGSINDYLAKAESGAITLVELDFFKEIALSSICYDFNHRLEQPDNIDGLLSVREFIIHEATKILELMDSGVIKIVQSNYYLDKRRRGTNS